METTSHTINYLFSEMPELKHEQEPMHEGSQNFGNSAVLRWIAANPDLIRFIFYLAKVNGAIRYDPARKTWVGAMHANQIGSQKEPHKCQSRVGRPPKFTVDQILEVLPQRPVSVADWASISKAKTGVSRRTFSALKQIAISEGKVRVRIDGRKILCERTPATPEKSLSTHSTDNHGI